MTDERKTTSENRPDLGGDSIPKSFKKRGEGGDMKGKNKKKTTRHHCAD